jgi:hypothetical protein
MRVAAAVVVAAGAAVTLATSTGSTPPSGGGLTKITLRSSAATAAAAATVVGLGRRIIVYTTTAGPVPAERSITLKPITARKAVTVQEDEGGEWQLAVAPDDCAASPNPPHKRMRFRTGIARKYECGNVLPDKYRRTLLTLGHGMSLDAVDAVVDGGGPAISTALDSRSFGITEGSTEPPSGGPTVTPLGVVADALGTSEPASTLVRRRRSHKSRPSPGE